MYPSRRKVALPLPKEFNFSPIYATFPAGLFLPLQRRFISVRPGAGTERKNNSSTCQRTEILHDNNKEKMLQGQRRAGPLRGQK